MIKREIRKSFVIDSSADRVFRALTDDGELTKWFPKAGARVDLKIGGLIEFKTQRPDTGEINTINGTIVELVANAKFSHTWSSSSFDSESLVTWILDPIEGSKTRVSLVHSGIVSDDIKFADADRGWSYFSSRLAKFCSEN